MNNSQEKQQDVRLTEQLRRAVRSEAVPPYLEARIRNTIRSSQRRPSRRWRLVPVAAGLAVCISAIVAYELGRLRLTISSQESYIASVSNRVASLMRVGLGDHIHCSVFRKFPKNPPAPGELVEELGQEYKDLIPIVRKHVPEEYRMVIAHQCRYHGRKFVHLSLKSDSRLLSLVIARKNDGESFETEGLAPALVESGIPVYRAGVQRFQIASFESREHLVYFVSDLAQQQNMKIMLALAPEVKRFLASKEL
jgi:hypothetical protein